MTTLPGVAGQIEQAIGLELAVQLLRRRGGTQVTVPTRPAGSYLADVIGVEATRTLIAVIGPGKITLPCASMRGAKARRADAKAMLRAGKSLLQVALDCDLHTRTVSNYRTEIEAEGGKRQLDLPL